MNTGTHPAAPTVNSWPPLAQPHPHLLLPLYYFDANLSHHIISSENISAHISKRWQGHWGRGGSKHPKSNVQLSERGPNFLSGFFWVRIHPEWPREAPLGSSLSTFHFEIISDLPETHKNSTKNSHCTPHPDSSNLTMLYNQSTTIEIRKSTCLKYYDLIYRSYLHFASSVFSFHLETFLSLALSSFLGRRSRVLATCFAEFGFVCCFLLIKFGLCTFGRHPHPFSVPFWGHTTPDFSIVKLSFFHFAISKGLWGGILKPCKRFVFHHFFFFAYSF